MRIVLACLTALLIAGCQNSASRTQAECTALHEGYLAMWACTRAKIAPAVASDPNADLGLRYIAAGDALAERVRNKQIGDADAKLALAQEVSSATGEGRRRRAMAAASDPVVCNRIGFTTICN